MELIERDSFLSLLDSEFRKIEDGEGHCVLVTGEAGIGKTSLVKSFCKKVVKESLIYHGTCDALFTPRPLGPVLDILWQMHSQSMEDAVHVSDRSALFSRVLHEIKSQRQTTIIIIEDIHWADEATLDFIKFFARRITALHCLLILTYRDDEIHTRHPLRNVLGQLPPDSFTRLQLTLLSRQAVETMSNEKGYNGEDVYSISGGNPFYVTEILANYSIGVPDNIRDSIMSSFNRMDENTRQIWEILSIMPTGFEIKYLEKMEPAYAAAIQYCLELRILILKNELISFKHELYRRTIEDSLSPIVRTALNKRILEMFCENFEQNGEVERIIHHAKNANENEIVVKYAPSAAKQASMVGAHIEAAKLYLTAIEYYQGQDKNTLIDFYRSYAYECYLTNHVKSGIVYIEKALNLLEATNDVANISACMHLLSWFWWFDGNGKKAEASARKIMELVANESLSSTTAMAFAHLGRLKMLSDEMDECFFWSEQAIAIAKESGDEKILCYTLNSMGAMLAKDISTREKGLELLKQSMDLALKNDYEEYIGHAYVNQAVNAVRMKDYTAAKKILEAAVQFLEERDIELGVKYLLAYEARLALETGNWDKASSIANNFINNDDFPTLGKIGVLVVAATIRMRRGEDEVLPRLLEAKDIALNTGEPQRILPPMIALLEYEWITGQYIIEKTDLENVINMCEQKGNIYENSAFAFWLLKARKQKLSLIEFYDGYRTETKTLALKASALWKRLGCPYEQALTLFEGDDNDKREAIGIIQKLGANAIYEKMKFEMRASGIKSIPRGIRKSTKSNPANLTERELDILQLLKEGLQNKEIAAKLFISPKTVDHHISSIFFKLDVNSRSKAVQEAGRLEII